MQAWPWRRKSPADYVSAWSACVTTVTVLSNRIRILRGRLRFNASKDGPRGRALEADIPELGLQRSDRLEPSRARPDVAVLNETECSVDLTFWRRRRETWVLRRNPLLEVLGVSVAITLVPDWMHGLSLGVFQSFISAVLFAFVSADVFQIGGGKTSILIGSQLRVREALFSWYKAQERLGFRPNRVQDFTSTMMATAAGEDRWQIDDLYIIIIIIIITPLFYRTSGSMRARRTPSWSAWSSPCWFASGARSTLARGWYSRRSVGGWCASCG